MYSFTKMNGILHLSAKSKIDILPSAEAEINDCSEFIFAAAFTQACFVSLFLMCLNNVLYSLSSVEPFQNIGVMYKLSFG